MLKIWYYSGTEYIKDAPSYFDNVYKDEWIEDAFVKVDALLEAEAMQNVRLP